MKKKVLKNITVNNQSSLDSALIKMNKWGHKSLVVLDKNLKYVGILSDGDVRKSLIKGKKLSDKIIKIYQKKTTYFFDHDYSIDKIKNFFLKKQLDIIPIIDKRKKLIKVCKLLVEKYGEKYFSWWCLSTVKCIDEEVLTWLNKAGCEQIHIGVETGSERLYKIIEKGCTKQEARDAILLAKKHKFWLQTARAAPTGKCEEA